MSQETIEWLNSNVLMGFTEDREHWAGGWVHDAATGTETSLVPWFADKDYTGGYAGPVPVEAVHERLFHWDAIEGPMLAQIPCEMDRATTIGSNGEPTRTIEMPDHKAILRSDNDLVLGVFKSGYTIHQYNEWLIENVASILDDNVLIDSAGLLKGGGVAWVSISLPDTVVTDAGFAIRPRILSFTSHNGQHATTYMRSVNAPVCDNSLAVEISSGDGQRVKIKHSSNSGVRIGDARDALGILYQDTEDTIKFFDDLAKWEVTDRQFRAVLDALEPMPERKIDNGKVTNLRSVNAADRRRVAIGSMYVKDDRAAPWRGTALGVLQAFNTFDQQERQVNGERVERQMIGTLAGAVDRYDVQVLDALAASKELVPA